MTSNGSSLIGRLRAFGPDDPVFDGLLLAGPLIVVLLALLGRNPVSQALAGLYLFALVARTGQNALASDGEEDGS